HAEDGRLSLDRVADGDRELDRATAQRGDYSPGRPPGAYRPDSAHVGWHCRRWDCRFMGWSHDHVLGGAARRPSARVALWTLCPDFCKKGGRSRTLGAALRLNGHLHLAIVAGCTASHWYSRWDCSHGLSRVFDIHAGRLRHLV